MRLRIVVQRYGSEILGGAERHAALIASLLSPHHDLEVWTTTAGDYQTWSPAYPEGFSTVEGIRVCLLYTSPSPRDKRQSRMPSSA